MDTTLKARHQQILDYLHHYTKEHGFPPSVREICAATGLKSPSTVHRYLGELEQLGFLKRDPAKPRAIVLTTSSPSELESEQRVKSLPVLGRISAGLPILAEEHLMDVIPFAESLLGSGNHFMLKVSGESMIEAGILPEDYVIVRQQNTAENGDIVVALLGEEATVKRFYKEQATVKLQPANSQMQPIYSNEVKVIGKVIGLYRAIN
ncbi:MAG: transcriptional repressor LexA [Firmicutes bacterium]|nr:transcriptional repressor LexA [Bacillota bacterium]